METAVQPCAYHDDREAAAVCSECSAPICDECRKEVAGHVVCVKCVDEIRARVSAEMDSGLPPHPVSTPPGSTFVATPSIPIPPPGVESTQVATPSIPIPPPGTEAAQITTPSIPIPPPSPARILVGIALGLAAGWIGAFIRAQVMYRTGFQIGLIDSFLGFAVGFAVVLGGGRSGIVPAIIGAVIAFGAITYGWYLLYGYVVTDELVKLGGAQAAAFSPLGSFLQEAPGIIRRWNLMAWVFVAIGVYGGFITPYRAAPPTAANVS